MDEKMEIRLVNPTEDGFLQKIDWNKAELEANVRSIVEAYQGLVYTEDTVSDAKNDRAALRKLLNEIEDRRKLVKKKCMEPYEVCEGTCRQCGRRILWVRMKSGKNMPVDMALHNYKKDSTGKEKIVTSDGEVVTGRILVGERGDGAGYISHFASCKKYRR